MSRSVSAAFWRSRVTIRLYCLQRSANTADRGVNHIIASLGAFTDVSILIILLLAIGLHVRWSRRVAAAGPTLLTTVGIFFCFAGITWGLVDFDPSDVIDSVPHLLQGIRTSFWASVFGIGCALTIKLRLLFFGEPALLMTGVPAGATIDDLIVQLRKLERSVAGADDCALLGQVKLLRNDSNAKLDGLNQTFQRFADNIVAANLEALVQALTKIVAEFNVQLNEQFGENFKNLNCAVAKLVVWQKQYEQQLNSLIEEEIRIRNNLAAATLSIGAFIDKASTFTPTLEWSERLDATLQNLTGLCGDSTLRIRQIEPKLSELSRQMEQVARVSRDRLSSVPRASNSTADSIDR
jgi:hypothetical protein